MAGSTGFRASGPSLVQARCCRSGVFRAAGQGLVGDEAARRRLNFEAPDRSRSAPRVAAETAGLACRCRHRRGRRDRRSAVRALLAAPFRSRSRQSDLITFTSAARAAPGGLSASSSGKNFGARGKRGKPVARVILLSVSRNRGSRRTGQTKILLWLVALACSRAYRPRRDLVRVK